ncbi:MAG: polysaccharide biosynthesis tyrosine autokinase [Marinilabiliaceae bacterium]|nr:polysaccharide biosynthesis tyrosine autokinase [Marinilabiliaceae bacterium]
MTQNIDELAALLKEEESIDIKEWLYRFLSNWYWFALFGILGLSLAFFINKTIPASYEVSGTILLSDENKSGVETIFEGLNFKNKTNIENHMLMLQSYTLNRKTLENLNWEVFWYQKGLLKDVILYKNTPYKIHLNHNAYNITNVKITIEQTGNNTFQLNATGNTTIDGVMCDIEIDEKGSFGTPVISNNLNLTVNLSDELTPDPEKSYYFIINDINQLTRNYQKALSVTQATKEADGIQFSLKGSHPGQMVDYLNELMKVYIAYGLDQKNKTSENTVRFIDAQLDNLVDSLTQAGENFTRFRSQKGIVDLSQEASLVMEKLQTLEEEKNTAGQRLEYYRNLRQYMGNADQMKAIVAPSVVGITDPTLNSQVMKLAELYQKKVSISYVAKENNPGLLMINEEIKTTISSLDENLRNLLNNAENELASLDRRFSDVQLQMAGLPKTEQELINIKRSFDLNNELYTFLLEKRAEAAITTASNVPDAQVLDPARKETTVPVGPKTTLNLLIGLILGLAIPFLFIILTEYFNDTIRNREELEKQSKLPFIGEVAHNQYQAEIPVLKHPRSGIAETFRGLRVNIQYLIKENDPKIIAIHSMIPGEGKTFTALNLASILAINNKKVLLVGCDLRKPRLHQIFASNNDKGLSNFLIGKESFDDIIKPTELETLFYVNSGPIPPNPSELISNTNFSTFIELAWTNFDYVILDNAPVTLVIDGLIVSKYASVNLMVLRQAFSHKKQIQYINQLAEKQQLNNIGLILNDTVHHNYGKAYGAYGYGYGYYDEASPALSIRKRILKYFIKNS